MWTPEVSTRRVFCALAFALLICLPTSAQPNGSASPAAGAPCVEPSPDIQKLAAGEILVDSQELDGIRYVTARVWMDETPERTWRTLANPFEFEGRICQRMKKVEVLADQPDMSIIDCTIGVVFPIPDFKYVVESHYNNCNRVDFHRVSGSFRDFRGFWDLQPVANGTKTEVTYSMYMDPGFFVPEWLVREAVRHELPSVLSGLRARLNHLKTNPDAAEKRSLMAATTYGALPVTANLARN